MSVTPIHKNIVTVLVLLCLLPQPATASKDELSGWLDRLDKSLAETPKYEEQYLQQITNLKQLLTGHESPDTRFDVCHQIYHAYQSYRADSALIYAYRCLDIAKQMKRTDYTALAECDIAAISVSTGDNILAYNLLMSIHPDRHPVWLKKIYYQTKSKFWVERSNYIGYQPSHSIYETELNSTLDSLIALSKPGSAEWYAYKATESARQNRHREAIEFFRQALADTSQGKHIRAMRLAEMAWSWYHLGNKRQATIAFIQSAILDNESTTREITSLYQVGNLIRQIDDVRASRYVTQALSWLDFYNAQIRFVEIGKILPVIEKERFEALRSERNLLIAVIILTILLTAFSTLGYIYIRKQNLKLKATQALNVQHLARIKQANDKLKEANRIKDEYIGRTLYDTSEFIGYLEHLFNKISRSLITKHYDEIGSTVSQDKLSEERKNMFGNFDKTFLALFPDFVDKYNSLFDEPDRKKSCEANQLTSEMRIFALIRLGIKDSERIARFLGYSVHTVNTYKTRAKNRSRIPNEEFEPKVMSF